MASNVHPSVYHHAYRSIPEGVDPTQKVYTLDELGQLLIDMRESNKWPKAEEARRSGDPAVTKETIWRYEMNLVRPKNDRIDHLARVCGYEIYLIAVKVDNKEES